MAAEPKNVRQSILEMQATREYKRNRHLLEPLADGLLQLLPEPAAPPVVPPIEMIGAWQVVTPEDIPQTPRALGPAIRESEKAARKRLSKKEGAIEIRNRVNSITQDPAPPTPGRVSNTDPATVEALRSAAEAEKTPVFNINLYV